MDDEEGETSAVEELEDVEMGILDAPVDETALPTYHNNTSIYHCGRGNGDIYIRSSPFTPAKSSTKCDPTFTDSGSRSPSDPAGGYSGDEQWQTFAGIETEDSRGYSWRMRMWREGGRGGESKCDQMYASWM
ncbi:hypothetical protein BDZ89DRAFT_265201 [Hymenopellis radicata]|nr:hypothetical protein BDZ89DRAFT_265201 [Hymenopellis radicata]